ncbi:MAG: DUF2778 domain-containing protein [Methylobacteriaceae bacterium]|nr:DUF2778 domain-containing protein [Methylobacteriaceae bacterium]
MTYCASYSRSGFERRPLSRDILSITGLGSASLAFIGLAGACLIYAQPGDTARVIKTEIAIAAKVAAAPKTAPALQTADGISGFELRKLTFSLDFAPRSLSESAPRRTGFDTPAPAVRIASIAPEKVVPEKVVPAPVPAAAEIAENIPLPARRPIELSRPPAASRVAQAAAAPAPTKPAETSSIFDKLFGLGNKQPSGPVLAYANPEDGVVKSLPGVAPTTAAVAPAADKFTAIYDITARTVYLPNGTKLEAHSGLREYLDDPRYVNVRMHGATPPATYDLKLRESLFHGVRALRLTPVGGNVFGRAGLLAHTYMLGPNGDSNGCVSFRDYDAFLQAYLRGEVKRLTVVSRLN